MAEHTGNEAGSDEWEEEETTVVVELSGILESDFISQCDGDCKVLGMDTDKPLLQLDRYTFSGEYFDTMGTNLIFTQEDAENVEPKPFHEAAERPTKQLEYLCKVDKKLSMSRVFVSKTSQGEGDRDLEDDNTTDGRIKEKKTNVKFSGNRSNNGTSDTDKTAMSVECAVSTQQMDTSSAATSSLTETSSVVPDSETSSAVPGSETSSTVPGSETSSEVTVEQDMDTSSALSEPQISISDAASLRPGKQCEPDG